MTTTNPAHSIQAITLEFGMGEYLYEIKPILYNDNVAANIHNDKKIPDVLLSLEQLKEVMPNLRYIAIRICWFATSVDAGIARIIPKIENKKNPLDWKVSDYTRENAEEVLRFSDGKITYGGTPTDGSIVELCEFLKNKNYKITLTPLIMVDDNSLKKPWHGDIKPSNKDRTTDEINHFFKGDRGYNKFIIHYANLEHNGIKLKNLIDSFVIGHELKGLTSASVTVSEDPKMLRFPGVEQLKKLAAEVKQIVGQEVKLTYSANWGDEYHHTAEGFYNLDSLWSDSNIDAVGISAYFPLSDLPQDQITFAKIARGFFSGEGYDYYKSGNNKVEFEEETWAWKNFAYWWDSTHYNPNGSTTEWSPKLKPIWFTEYGFASVDGTTKAPHQEGTENSNIAAQSLAIAATEYFLEKINKLPNYPNLIPRHYLKGWDARPYPDFPNKCNVWFDCNKWSFSHMVNGKIGKVMVETEVIGEIDDQANEL